jgi:hypothetical protein
MGSTGTPIASSSALMLARLISETYLSVVAFGLGRASAKACLGASTTRSGPLTVPPRKFSKNSAIRLHPSASVNRAQQYPAVFSDP